MQTTYLSLNGVRMAESEYAHGRCYLRLYGDLSDPNSKKLLKLVRMKTVRNSGLDLPSKEHAHDVNDEKLENNISRARNKIFELAFCNHWDYFVTATLDGTKYNREDLETFHKDLTKWLSNQSHKLGSKIHFLLIPELHSDGRTWHMHGFICGLPSSELKQFRIGDRMGKGIAAKVKQGDLVYDWPSYRSKFGFCDLEPIKNHEAVSKYVTKYISKSLANSVSDLHAHLYYHSRGLSEAKDIKRGTLGSLIPSVPISSLSCEHCIVEWYSADDLDGILSAFSDSEYITYEKFLEESCIE